MKTALHSVSYAGFWRNQHFLTLEDFILKAKDLGFDGVELTAKRPHLSALDYDDKRLGALAALMRDNGIECAALAAYTDFCAGLSGGMIPMLEMQLGYIMGLCRMAAALECKLIRIFTGYEDKSNSYWAQWDACIQAVRACCDIAGDYGITIGIQNHHDIAVDAPSLRAFFDEADRPNLKAMLDPWFIAAVGGNAAQSIDLIGTDIVYSTFADYERVRRYNYDPGIVNYTQDTPMLKAVRIGEGIINAAEYIKNLKRIGYTGYLAYEMCSEIKGGGSEANLDAYARGFIEFVNQQLD